MPAPAKKIWIRVRLSKRQIDALSLAVRDFDEENEGRLEDDTYSADDKRQLLRTANEAFAAHHALTRAYEIRTWQKVVLGRGVTMDDLWAQCRGTWQRGLVMGDHRPSLSDLRGTAYSYGFWYRRSMENLFERIEKAGIKITYTKGPNGRVGLRFDRKKKVKK